MASDPELEVVSSRIGAMATSVAAPNLKVRPSLNLKATLENRENG